MSDVTLERYDGPAALERADEVTRLYVATHEDLADNRFYSAEESLERFQGYVQRDRFELLIAVGDGAWVGQSWGFALGPNTGWWRGLTTEVPDEFTDERDGRRTFAFSELMVHPDHRGQGIARRLHDELLANRIEERATLLVRESNTRARGAYERWGWRKAAQLQPYPHAPVMDVMMLDLPRADR